MMTIHKHLAPLALLLATATLAANSSAQTGHSTTPMTKPAQISAQQQALEGAMRKLWEDHVAWTRLYIVSAAADLPDKGAVAGRLLQNQADIGNAVKPFYGDTAGDKLAALLKDHILIAADLVSAAKAGDSDAVGKNGERWNANADEIATLLSGANPKNWPADEMRAMMREHLALTTEEAVAQIKGDWEGSIKAYDKARAQLLAMADMLSQGIVRQFPDRFK